MPDDHPNAVAYRRTADAFRSGDDDGSSRAGVDVHTRVVSAFRYLEGQQLERWFYPDDHAAWDSIFDDARP